MNQFINEAKASKTPARLDVAQSLSGLALALFMWTHLILVSSILLGKDAMYYLTGFMEGRFLTGWTHGYPLIVSTIGIIVFFIFILHAGIAMRKFPASWRQWRIMRNQMKILHHHDTDLWFVQAVTGFTMFFLATVHVYFMITNPEQIGPHLSSDRFWSGWWWPLYLVLLFAVELHATIGMYRLAVKWGVLDGKNPRVTRKRLKVLKNALTVFFLAIGVLTFGTYMKIGYDQAKAGKVGERYEPTKSTAMADPGGDI